MKRRQEAYKIQHREQIRKQQQEIENLLKGQEELNRGLFVYDLTPQHQDSEDAQRLHAILQQSCRVDEELERERQCQRELQKELSDMEMKHADWRKGEVTTSHKPATQQLPTQKATQTLDNNLARASNHFSEQLTKNNHLRDEVQTLRVAHARFQRLHHRLEKDLQVVRKNIGEMNNLTTAARDAKSEAQSKMTMMRGKAVKDLAQDNADIKELERVLAHKWYLKEFMTTKRSERISQDDSQEVVNRQLSELKEQREMKEMSLDTLEENIQTLTGTNLDMQVTKLIQVEDRNFALFSFVVEQNKEIKAVEDEISQAQGEIEQVQVEDSQKEQDRESLLKDTDEQKGEFESQDVEYENKVNTISKILDQIKTGVKSILSMMECDCSKVEDKLGSSAGITENNIMSYLGLIEHKTNELRTVQAFLSSKVKEKNNNPVDLANLLLGQNPKMLKQDSIIQAVLTGVLYDTEESTVLEVEDQPYSSSELRQRIMKQVMQAETKSSKIIQ
ncbi:hypothetical protein LDENG_00002170 [Lucifuga dentata]|nr:hypothetical protein LDENG_00002170 [Lucifuga dentata]